MNVVHLSMYFSVECRDVLFYVTRPIGSRSRATGLRDATVRCSASTRVSQVQKNNNKYKITITYSGDLETFKRICVPSTAYYPNVLPKPTHACVKRQERTCNQSDTTCVRHWKIWRRLFNLDGPLALLPCRDCWRSGATLDPQVLPCP